MAKKEREIKTTALVEVPFDSETPPVTWLLHVAPKLSPDQANALRRITRALDRQQAKLANGRRVVNPTDALKYLLEALAAQM